MLIPWIKTSIKYWYNYNWVYFKIISGKKHWYEVPAAQKTGHVTKIMLQQLSTHGIISIYKDASFWKDQKLVK